MKYSLLLLSTLFVIAACKKVETPLSMEEKLRDGRWRLDLSTTNGILQEFHKSEADTVDTLYTLYGTRQKPNAPEGVMEPIPDSLIHDKLYNKHIYPECKADDYLVFRENNNGALNTGEVKCPPGETQEVMIRYGTLDNDTRMYIYSASDMFVGISGTFGNDDVVADILEYTGDRLKLRYKFINNTNIPVLDTFVYTATLKRF